MDVCLSGTSNVELCLQAHNFCQHCRSTFESAGPPPGALRSARRSPAPSGGAVTDSAASKQVAHSGLLRVELPVVVFTPWPLGLERVIDG